MTDAEDERSRRVARNEALYRQVNERIEDVNEALGSITGDFAVVCECGDLDCAEQITVSNDAYERTRSRPTHFIVKPGHEIAEVEHVVDRDRNYLVVEKHEPEAVRFAEKTDPRD